MFDLGLYVLKFLAVVGGFAAGGLGSGWLVRLLARLSVRRPVGRPVLVPAQILGGVAAGLATWMIAFGGGSGSGMFGLSGATERERGLSGSRPQPAEPAELVGPKEIQEKPLRSERETTLRIEMLGGSRVQNGRFYLIEGEREPKDLADLEKTILSRKHQQDKPALHGLEILVYEDSVARNHVAVRSLERWAEEQQLSVILPPTKGTVPAGKP
jgi:hypothetical protein